LYSIEKNDLCNLFPFLLYLPGLSEIKIQLKCNLQELIHKFFWEVLKFEFKALQLLGRCSGTWATASAQELIHCRCLGKSVFSYIYCNITFYLIFYSKIMHFHWRRMFRRKWEPLSIIISIALVYVLAFLFFYRQILLIMSGSSCT
jgi:hypothetical protein